MIIITSAGARVHIGIRFASVRRPNMSAAEAWKSASTTTVVLLTLFSCCTLGFAAGVEEDDEAAAATGTDVGVPGAGVPDRDGSELTVKSLPWTSIITLGKLANFASITFGRRDRASVNNALTSGEDSVVSDQSYYIVEYVRCRREHPLGVTIKKGGQIPTHNEIGQSIANDFVRYFWDSQRAIDFSAIAGCACPFQYDFAIEDRNQPEKE